MHSPSIFNDLFSNVWSIFLVILFFGGSIFVHELGHFLAARRRGLKVERFSIGFGPKIFGWTKDGIDYRISLLPLGGYVALPQLADLEAIEGKYDKNDLPPITYSDKFIVAVMGAVFNVIFAFFLATILWVVGIPSTEAEQTTTIGYVQKEIFINEGEYAPGPAYKAGLRPGDKVLSVDGDAVHSFSDIQKLIITGSGRSSTGKPEAIFTIKRNGQTMTIPVHPRLALANLKSGDTMRIVGILPTHTIVVGGIMQDSPAEKAGLQVGDTILEANGQKLYSMNTLSDILEADPHTPVSLLIERGKERMTLEAQPAIIPITKPLLELTTGTGTLSFLQNGKQAPSILLFDTNETEQENNAQLLPESGDRLLAVNNKPVKTIEELEGLLSSSEASVIELSFERDHFTFKDILQEPLSSTLKAPETRVMLGFSSMPQHINTHPSPWRQFTDSAQMTLRVLTSLFSQGSDIKINNLMGPPGIVRVLHTFSLEDIRLVLWFTVLLNINLAILNLLPIPVLDGGQIVFATIAKLRGKPLSSKLIGSIQGTFMILLFSLMLYVSFFDIRRWQGDNDFEKRIELQQYYYIKPEFTEK